MTTAGSAGGSSIIRAGRCACGKVTFTVSDAPLRVGICHCTDCRKESGSAFMTFAIWPRHAFQSSGEVKYFRGRGFCPACGSRMFTLEEEEAEIRAGAFDMAPTDLAPTYELWIKRRENWLDPLAGAEQFDEDRV